MLHRKLIQRELVPLSEQKINALFIDAKKIDVPDLIIALYRMVFPEWDDLETIGPWPEVNYRTALALMGKFTKLDAGLLWMNKGFSHIERTADQSQIPDWHVDRSPCRPIYKYH